MITRPLGLLDRLRPAPRSFDAIFFVNAALLAVYFALFGSQFVISPGVQLENPSFAVPRTDVAVAGAARTALVIDIPRPGIVITPEGQQTYQRLGDWLMTQRGERTGTRVLVRIDRTAVPMQDLMTVYELIRTAGFDVQLAAERAPAAGLLPESSGE